MSINNMSVADLIYQMRLERGLINEPYEPTITVTPKRDFWQEGLNDEYQRAADLQDLINLGKQ